MATCHVGLIGLRPKFRRNSCPFIRFGVFFFLPTPGELSIGTTPYRRGSQPLELRPRSIAPAMVTPSEKSRFATTRG